MNHKYLKSYFRTWRNSQSRQFCLVITQSFCAQHIFVMSVSVSVSVKHGLIAFYLLLDLKLFRGKKCLPSPFVLLWVLTSYQNSVHFSIAKSAPNNNAMHCWCSSGLFSEKGDKKDELSHQSKKLKNRNTSHILQFCPLFIFFVKSNGRDCHIPTLRIGYRNILEGNEGGASCWMLILILNHAELN